MNPLQLPQNNQKKKITIKEAFLLIIVIPICLWILYSNFLKDESDKNDDYGTRANPAPIGKTAYYDGYIKNHLTQSVRSCSLQLTVTEVVRGQEANEMVKNASSRNDLPSEGEEYVLVKVAIKVVKLGNNQKYSVSIYDFDFTTKEGAVLDRASVSGLKPELSDIYEGGLTEGYLCCIVPIGTPMLLSWEEGERWFSLEPNQSETSAAESSSTEEKATDTEDITSSEIKDPVYV